MKRKAEAAKSSYAWAKCSLPRSVTTKTFDGLPLPRDFCKRGEFGIRGSRASRIPSATKASRWRRIPAGVRPNRCASTTAVDGPCESTLLATASRVEASSFFTT